MVLQFNKMCYNIIAKQFKISHVPCDVIVFKKEEIPTNILKLISAQYDDKFLNDCDNVVFIRGPIDKKMRKKIFNAVDKALGSDANLLTIEDVKLLKLHGDSQIEDNETDSLDKDIDDQVNDIVNEPDDAEDTEDNEDNEDNKDSVKDALKKESLNEKKESSKKSKDSDDEEDSDEEDSDDEDAEKDDSDDEEDSDAEKDDSDDEEDSDDDAENMFTDNGENQDSSDQEDDNGEEQSNVVPTAFVFIKVSVKN